MRRHERLARPPSLRPFLLGLCIACAAGVQGCSENPLEPVGKSPREPAQSPPDRAFFILQASDLRSARWPEGFRAYDLLVCNPALGAEELRTIRRELPGALLFAYTNIRRLPIGLWQDDPYWASLTAAFDSSLCVRDLATGDLVRVRRGDAPPSSNAFAVCVLGRASAEALVRFHSRVTMSRDWDGLYLDECTLHFPEHLKRAIERAASLYDIDGDGAPEDRAAIDRAYETWRPYLTGRLRETLGEGVLLIANSGGPLGDPALQGITLEGAGERFTVAEARAHLRGQRVVSRSPFLGVLWATTETSRLPSLELAAELESVLYGELSERAAH